MDLELRDHVFLSHAGVDKLYIEPLRRALEDAGIDVWIDVREMVAGQTLPSTIRDKISTARACVVVLSQGALNSSWVAAEVEHARAVAARRTDFRLIPIVVEPLSVTTMRWLFGAEYEPVAITARFGPGWADPVAVRVLEALREKLPAGPVEAPQPPRAPLAELRIELADPAFREQDGKRRAVAKARLFWKPLDGPEVRSAPVGFEAPLGPIEDEDLDWYLERYARWPYGLFRDRAKTIEDKLPAWGKDLFDAVGKAPNARDLFTSFRKAEADRRISILVEAPGDAPAETKEAATRLLALPWELLRDGDGYLSSGSRPALVRRRLPFYAQREALVTDPPLRILLVSPRPEDDSAGYIDHRVSARPVVEAVHGLGELARLTILQTPTFAALVEELGRAAAAKATYHVVHFDGHGVYDKKVGLGALCFEAEGEDDKLDGRKTRLIHGTELSEKLRDHRVPLFVLEACQSAKSDERVEASVAGQLLSGGVASVVAMSHSVLVETARRFVEVFYKTLCEGARVGEAMLRAQQHLANDPKRHDFTLQDWFVPVLYQEDDDPHLLHAIPGEQVKALLAQRRERRLGGVKDALPPHGFVGRSRELLRAERVLVRAKYVVLRADGGEGKTTLAAELAAWLVSTQRKARAAFLPLDKLPQPDVRTVLYALGEQLVTDFTRKAESDDKKAQQLVERALADEPTVIVLDNLETVLPSPGDPNADADLAEALLKWGARLSEVGRTHLVLTTREEVPVPFDGNEVQIGRLAPDEAIELVNHVLKREGLEPRVRDDDEDQLKALVEAVNGHARSLVLLAPEVARMGVGQTALDVAELMRELERRSPGNREKSLIASVELSLRRLPKGMVERIAPLAVFVGGGQLSVIAMVLGLDKDAAVKLAQQLVGVGLVEMGAYGYFRFDPALSAALDVRLDDEARRVARAAWAEAIGALIEFLYEQQTQDIEFAATLTALDLGNLLSVLQQRAAAPNCAYATVVDMATLLERLLQNLGRPSVLARVVTVRKESVRYLPEWSHATFLAKDAEIDRLLEAGAARAAVDNARALLDRANAAGEQAFPEAAYDMAMCHFTLGRTLTDCGDAAEALGLLSEAERRFEVLAASGSVAATRMVSAAITEQADCRLILGRLDEAAAGYEEAIRRATARGDRRDVAAGRFQLGSVRRRQRRYGDAIAAYTDARDTFEVLGEPRSVGTAWHQLGMAYREAGRLDAAEFAYQQALQIRVQHAFRSEEAATLGELGHLYNAQNRLDEAVRLYLRSAEISVVLLDMRLEGRSRNNAASDLIRLDRLDEARREILRALECNRPFGHTAEPWMAFDTLCTLERAAGNPTAAAEARKQARAAFLSYRRDGGENHNPGGRLALLAAKAIQTGGHAEAESTLTALAKHPNLPDHLRPMLTALAKHPNLPDHLRPMLTALTAILHGDRNPALADDPALTYADAVEIQLLLERLGPA